MLSSQDTKSAGWRVEQVLLGSTKKLAQISSLQKGHFLNLGLSLSADTITASCLTNVALRLCSVAVCQSQLSSHWRCDGFVLLLREAFLWVNANLGIGTITRVYSFLCVSVDFFLPSS